MKDLGKFGAVLGLFEEVMGCRIDVSYEKKLRQIWGCFVLKSSKVTIQYGITIEWNLKHEIK